jgi:hypothetical protein
MGKIRAFLIICTFICLFSYTSRVHSQSVIIGAIHPTVDRVRQECVLRTDWATRQCRVYNETGEMYQESVLWDGVGISGNIITGPAELIGGLIDSAETLGHLLSGDGERNLEQHVRRTIMQELNYVRQFNTLNDCQTSCLIKCAASAILRWEENNVSKFSDTATSYTSETGVCTEFARVAVDLGDSFGIPIRRAYGPQHAFNSFQINGRWYYGEPQSSSCDFFVDSNSTTSQLRRYTRDINGGRQIRGIYAPPIAAPEAPRSPAAGGN